MEHIIHVINVFVLLLLIGRSPRVIQIFKGKGLRKGNEYYLLIGGLTWVVLSTIIREISYRL